MRLRVTDLDAWQYWRESNQTFEEFMMHMRRERPPTRLMERGIAFHEALEKAIAATGTHDVMEAKDWEFVFPPELDIALPLAGCQSEVPGRLEYTGTTLTGRADAICGNTVWDFKTAQKSPDMERYYRSWQWRAYLEMFGGYRFTYQIFMLREEGNRATVVSCDRLDLYRYKRMGEDVRGAVQDLSEFMRRAAGWE